MMIDIIENTSVRAALNQINAELVSLKSCPDQFEYLWQDDDSDNSGHSPLLFPIVGNLPGDAYQLDGVTYEMGLHGIANLLQYKLVEIKPDRITYKTGQNEDTLKHYPYIFSLNIVYLLSESTLTIRWEIINLDSKTMYYSIGAHPFFNCPFFPGENMSDYLLTFEKAETINRRIKEGGLITGETEEFLRNSNEMRLSHSLFERDAIILEGLQSKWVEISSPRHDKSIRVYFEGFPYLGIWSFGDSPFVCIEPWQGIDSAVNDPQDFTLKEGLLKLKPSDSRTFEYNIIIR
jgi:galactose mutarotase-like enzyme